MTRTAGAGRQSGENEEGDEDRTTQAGPVAAVERRAPDNPQDMPRSSWWAVLRRTGKEFLADDLTDRAAALTYYSVLSLFPALLVLVSLLGIAGHDTAQRVLDNLQQLTPGAARQIVSSAVEQVQASGGTGSVLAVVGLLAAVWSASGYVAAFIRSANAVYDVAEGRPVWKVTPLRLILTVVLMVLACVSALIVVVSGSIAHQVGTALGIGGTAMTVWSFAKWPLLLVMVTLLIAILYWAAPNARVQGWKWASPGSLLALVIWGAASSVFSLYVSNFASYNKTYGALAGVIIFLIWLWITNLAILLGLEFDAEMARERAIVGGHPASEEPYVQPRDTRAWSDKDRALMED